MRERPNRLAWKASVGKLTVGSNPTPSAKYLRFEPEPFPDRFTRINLDDAIGVDRDLAFHALWFGRDFNRLRTHGPGTG